MAIINNFISIVTHKYFCFDGRTSRSEFWLYFLVYFIGLCILGLIPKIGNILCWIWQLVLLCPTLGCTARRLHDTGKSGWWQLLILIPVIGHIIVLLMCVPEGDKEPNGY